MNIIDYIGEQNPKALYPTGLEGAVIGITSNDLAVLDYDKCVSIFMDKDGMTEGEAHEWMSYNVTGAYMGENTPIFVHLKGNLLLDE